MSTQITTRNPVTWFEIHTGDPERTRRFYGEAFGWTFHNEGPGYDMIGMGDEAPIGGGLASNRPGQVPMTVFNVQVEDVDATCEAVSAAGGTVTMPPESAPNGLRFAYVADPDGSILGLWTPPVT